MDVKTKLRRSLLVLICYPALKITFGSFAFFLFDFLQELHYQPVGRLDDDLGAMFNVSGVRQEILAKTSYSLAVALPEILPLEILIWEYTTTQMLWKREIFSLL